MQQFRRGLQRYEAVIRLQTGCHKLQYESGQHGEFTVVLPKGKKTIRIHFSRKKVLGRTASKPPLQQRMVKKTCDFVREIISSAK